MVAVAVMLMRRRHPAYPRKFRVPALWLVGPLTIAGCLFLFLNLPTAAMTMLPLWTAVGVVVYLVYGRRHSHLAQGRVEVHEPEYAELKPEIPGVQDPVRS